MHTLFCWWGGSSDSPSLAGFQNLKFILTIIIQPSPGGKFLSFLIWWNEFVSLLLTYTKLLKRIRMMFFVFLRVPQRPTTPSTTTQTAPMKRRSRSRFCVTQLTVKLWWLHSTTANQDAAATRFDSECSLTEHAVTSSSDLIVIVFISEICCEW